MGSGGEGNNEVSASTDCNTQGRTRVVNSWNISHLSVEDVSTIIYHHGDPNGLLGFTSWMFLLDIILYYCVLNNFKKFCYHCFPFVPLKLLHGSPDFGGISAALTHSSDKSILSLWAVTAKKSCRLWLVSKHWIDQRHFISGQERL